TGENIPNGTSVTVQGVTVGAPVSINISASSVTNNGTLTVTNGALLIQSLSAALTVNGTGTTTATQLNFADTNSSGAITFAAGALQTEIGTVNLFAPNGSITGNSAGNLSVTGSLTLTANTVVNPGNLTATGNTIINFPQNSFSMGTIVNTNGDVV